MYRLYLLAIVLNVFINRTETLTKAVYVIVAINKSIAYARNLSAKKRSIEHQIRVRRRAAVFPDHYDVSEWPGGPVLNHLPDLVLAWDLRLTLHLHHCIVGVSDS